MLHKGRPRRSSPQEQPHGWPTGAREAVGAAVAVALWIGTRGAGTGSEVELTSLPLPCHQEEDLSRYFSAEFFLNLVGHLDFGPWLQGTKGSLPGTSILLPMQQGSEVTWQVTWCDLRSRRPPSGCS